MGDIYFKVENQEHFYRFNYVDNVVSIYSFSGRGWFDYSYKPETLEDFLDWYMSDDTRLPISYLSGDIVKRHIARMQ